MAIDICTLATFDGPNRFDPRPGVLAHLRAGRDYSPALRTALKDAAQRIGLVIAAPHIDSRVAEGEVWHEAFFVTPMPAIGAEMLRYVVRCSTRAMPVMRSGMRTGICGICRRNAGLQPCRSRRCN